MIFLLLGAVPDGPSADRSGAISRAQAMASARIVQGEVIEFGDPDSRQSGTAGGNRSSNRAIRSAGEIAGADGRTIRLEEFH